jgi:hypothetical protein
MESRTFVRASPANCEAAIQPQGACGTIVKSSIEPNLPAADFAVMWDELIELREQGTIQSPSISLARLHSTFAIQ